MASGVRAAAPPAPAGPSRARSKPGPPPRVPRPQPAAKRPATPVSAGLPRAWTPQHLRPQRPGLTLPRGQEGYQRAHEEQDAEKHWVQSLPPSLRSQGQLPSTCVMPWEQKAAGIMDSPTHHQSLTPASLL
ncbi:putative HTLV-1-related endogenous sequence [Mus caroli]|uniref:HTLV-1-related endogenous sequence n=1 Tax=Mus caroli TaxID=10089 RepID=A0A6P5R1R8_MUSCR|nr:putative HTLV-1-related endogenous sequence [Mus caroli]